MKALLDAHGARIEVDSAPRQGTTFRLWFPLVEEGGEGRARPVGGGRVPGVFLSASTVKVNGNLL